MWSRYAASQLLDHRCKRYRPPPAQAQAQPAHAHAQAHPPPPLRPPRELDEGFGGGLVTLVTRLVKSVTLPITFCEKVCTPVTMDAAKSEPGKFGTEGMETEGLDPPVEAGADRGKVGS